MFHPALTDLSKPQWIATLEAVKRAGGMSTGDLATHLGVSYMATKQYAEDLTRLGYLQRIRVPRTAVGRPEIFYRCGAKTDALFPDAGMPFSLELLENSRQLFGETAPERLIYQHFEMLRERWSESMQTATTPGEHVHQWMELRGKYGAPCAWAESPDGRKVVREYHHPLRLIFQHYPRAISLDLRVNESLLGMHLERHEIPGGQTGPSFIDYHLPELDEDP